MTSSKDWQRLFKSDDRAIRIRAAAAMLKRDDTPNEVLLEILDHYSQDGLGAATERALLNRNGNEFFQPMVDRLDSSDDFVREVACRMLGNSGNVNATPFLLAMLDDPHMMVRRAAGIGLGALRDPNALDQLKNKLESGRKDDVNVRWALERAIRDLDSGQVNE